VPWAWAFDAPFPWAGQVASHLGGTHQGMAISWPKAIKDRGGLRHQFHHIIDVVPTVLGRRRSGSRWWSTASGKARSRASA
jgi:arylsulfatase